MAPLSSITVVGTSLAGLRCVETLRRREFEGPITWIGEEERLPYDRPPLSKEVLRGEWGPERIALRPKGYDDLDVDLRRGVRATALDVGTRTVSLDDGSTVAGDAVVIATGARVRTLPGTPDLAGIHVLRTLDDALSLRSELERSPAVVVVGAGFIGSEVAVSCRARGLDVTVLEAAPVPMERVLGREMGMACVELHRDHSVDVRLGVGVEGFVGTDRVEGVTLGDGSTVPADVVVVGVGVVPNTDWLDGSGLTIDNGVVCDSTCLAAPGVVAAGDVARWHHPVWGSMRVEHWTNAVEQGMHAAERLLAPDDTAPEFAPVPFVWSDQYDIKIQFVGSSRAGDDVQVVHGSIDERKLVALYGREGRVVGALAFDNPRLLMTYRRLIDQGSSWDDAQAEARRLASI